MDKKSVHFKDLKKDCKYNIYDKEGVAVYGNPYLLTIKSIDNKHAVFRTLDECYTEEIKPYDPVIFSIEELGYRYVLVEEESAIDHGYLSFSELEKDKSYDWYFNDRGNITPMICNPHKVVDRSEDQIVFLDSKGKCMTSIVRSVISSTKNHDRWCLMTTVSSVCAWMSTGINTRLMAKPPSIIRDIGYWIAI